MLAALPTVTGLSGTSHWRAAINDAGHALVFGAMAWLVHTLLERYARRQPQSYLAGGARTRLVVAFALSVLIGAAVELVQASSGRGASAFDLLTDASGAAFLLAVVSWRRSTVGSNGRRAISAAIAAISAGVILAPLAEVAAAYRNRSEDWPSLISEAQLSAGRFINATGGRLFWAKLPADWAAPANQSALELRFSGRGTPTIRWVEPWPDWRDYSALEIDIVNPDDRHLRWMLRVHDALHNQRHSDRFNLPIDLPARSRLVVRVALEDVARAPKDRRLDLSRIRGVALFERHPASGAPGTLWITRAELTR